MLEYFKNSIGEKTFNHYGIYLGNEQVSNAEGVSRFNTKLSPVIIQNFKKLLSRFKTVHYQEYRFIDKNTILRICNGERKYHRENVEDTEIDESLSEHLKFVNCKIYRNDIPRTEFPSKSNYHELSSDTTEYSVSDTIKVLIRNSSKVYIELKKDEYIDTTIECLETTIKELVSVITSTNEDATDRDDN